MNISTNIEIRAWLSLFMATEFLRGQSKLWLRIYITQNGTRRSNPTSNGMEEPERNIR